LYNAKSVPLSTNVWRNYGCSVAVLRVLCFQLLKDLFFKTFVNLFWILFSYILSPQKPNLRFANCIIFSKQNQYFFWYGPFFLPLTLISYNLSQNQYQRVSNAAIRAVIRKPQIKHRFVFNIFRVPFKNQFYFFFFAQYIG
jgi:hypothetical protein